MTHHALVTQRDVVNNRTTLSGNIGTSDIQTDNSFHVVTGGSVGPSATLDGFTIRSGYADGAGVAGYGGGVYIMSGSPTLTNLIFSANAANFGAGLYNESGSPALANVTFSANTANRGGGLYNASGSPTLTNVNFFTNSAGDRGGGLSNDSGGPEFNNVAFAENSANYGGGVSNADGSPTLTNVSFVANLAFLGGGLFNGLGSPSLTNITFSANSGSVGGGLYNGAGGPAIINATFAGNSADDAGGGLFNSAGSLALTHATFTHNRALNVGGGIHNYEGSLTLSQSVLWDNEPSQFYESFSGLDASIGHNLIEGGCPADTMCAPPDIITADPLLGALADNGGFTRTHSLKPGSPAIDAATPMICTTIPTDERGVARPADGNKGGTPACDLGAFEYVPPAPTIGFAVAASSGSESVTTVSVPVKLSTTAVGPVTVQYKIANGTAKSPSDYAAGTGALTIPALTTTATVTFTVVNDRFDEPGETVVITLSSPAAATLGTVTHTYTIADDDPRSTCRGRLPTIVGTSGNDTLTGTKGADVIVGLDGNDTITGNGGDDVICAGAGNDTVSGGNGNDMLRGEGGNDRLTGDRGSDLLSGGGGEDKLAGGPSANDGCDGGPGVDALLPSAGCESTSSVP